MNNKRMAKELIAVARDLMETPRHRVGIDKRDALDVLREVKSLLGRNYKQAIRAAWFNGNYRAEGLEEWSSQLQNIRNTFGPSWLVRARV